MDKFIGVIADYYDLATSDRRIINYIAIDDYDVEIICDSITYRYMLVDNTMFYRVDSSRLHDCYCHED